MIQKHAIYNNPHSIKVINNLHCWRTKWHRAFLLLPHSDITTHSLLYHQNNQNKTSNVENTTKTKVQHKNTYLTTKRKVLRLVWYADIRHFLFSIKYSMPIFWEYKGGREGYAYAYSPLPWPDVVAFPITISDSIELILGPFSERKQNFGTVWI